MTYLWRLHERGEGNASVELADLLRPVAGGRLGGGRNLAGLLDGVGTRGGLDEFSDGTVGLGFEVLEVTIQPVEAVAGDAGLKLLQTLGRSGLQPAREVERVVLERRERRG